MTKEDEARLAEIRAKRFVTGPGWLEISFLLRLLDAQAARVAALEETGDLLASDHFDRCNECDHSETRATTCATLAPWDAAIRARAETPIGAVVEGVLDRRSDLMHQLAAAPQAGKPPVAPGEVKP